VPSSPASATAETTASSELVSDACGSGLSSWQSGGPVLSTFACVGTPEVSTVKVQTCADGTAAEACPSALSADSSPDANAVSPPPTASDYPAVSTYQDRGAASGPMISNTTWIIAAVSAFVGIVAIAAIAWKVRQMLAGKSKRAFEADRRRASVDLGSVDVQMGTVGQGEGEGSSATSRPLVTEQYK